VYVLLGRNVLGLALSLLSMGLIFTRLSAGEYGPIVLAQAIFLYVTTAASAGVDTNVLRLGKELHEDEAGSLYLFHLLSITFFNAIAIAVVWVWGGVPIDGGLLMLVASAYVVRGIAAVPAARLESLLDFRQQARCDLASQLAYTLVLCVFLLGGLGAYAVGLGLAISAGVYSFMILRASPLAPCRPREYRRLAVLLREGIVLQSNNWIWQFKDFALPLILKDAGGMALVGMYGLANQFVQKLGFIRQVIWRVSVPAIAQYKTSPALPSQITRTSELQALVVAVLMMGLALVMHALDHFGADRWRGAASVYPAIAINMLLNSAFSITCAALVVFSRLRQLVVFHALFVTTVLAVLWVAARHDPVRALWLAELSGVVAYAYLASVAREQFPGIGYGYSILVLSLAILALVVDATLSTPWWTLTLMVAISVMPRSVRHIRTIIHDSMSLRRKPA